MATPQQVQKSPTSTKESTPATSTTPAASAVQRSALRGKSYDEQVQMLAPVQMKDGEAEAQGGEADKPAAIEESLGVGPYAYSGAELVELLDGLVPDNPERWHKLAQSWLRYGIRTDRVWAKDKAIQSDFSALEVAGAFETGAEAALPEDAKVVLAALPSRAQWLSEVLDAFLRTSPMGNDALKEDRGAANSSEDKSAALTAAFVKKLDDMQAIIGKVFPADGAAVVKEIVLRRELFELMAQHHDKSDAESGISSQQKAVENHENGGATSCNVYNATLLEQGFNAANAAQGDIEIKKTSMATWEQKKVGGVPQFDANGKPIMQTGRAPAAKQYAFYDNLGRAAKDAGAWTDGGPGVRPKAGDIYVLQKGGGAKHIGFFKFAETTPAGRCEIWHTMDGGQPAGTTMTGTVGGQVKSFRDGSLNNVKRAWDTTNNEIWIPQPKNLAELRGENPDTATGTVKINQDGEVRSVAGIIDVGKLIASGK